jgi:hypothetical protein
LRFQISLLSVLFSAAVIHWVTSRDSTTSPHPSDDTTPSSSNPNHHQHSNNNGGIGIRRGPRVNDEQLTTLPRHAHTTAGRHHHHIRLPDDNDSINNNEIEDTKSGMRRTAARQSHLSLSTEAEEPIMVDHDGGKLSITPGSSERGEGDGEGEGEEGDSPCSSATTFQKERGGEDKNPFSIVLNTRETSTETETNPPEERDRNKERARDDGLNNEREERDSFRLPLPPPSSRRPHSSGSSSLLLSGVLLGGGLGTNTPPARNRAPSEVRVDVDYGATTTTLAEDGRDAGPEMALGNSVVIGAGGAGMEAGISERQPRSRGSGWR